MADNNETRSERQGMDASLEAMGAMERILAQLSGKLSPDLVVGSVQQIGDQAVIPLVEAMGGGGFGVGAGSNAKSNAENQGSGSGGGAGGGLRCRPVAVVIVTPNEVRVEPVFDLTQVGLAALATAGFSLFWVLRMLRGSDVKSSTFSRLNPSRWFGST